MIKIIGALLIILACGSIGVYASACHMRETRNIRTLMHSIDNIYSELQFHMTPLPDVFRMVSKEAVGDIGKFFNNLAEELDRQIKPDAQKCVEVVLSQLFPVPSLTLSCLEELGVSLGKYDLEGQLRGLNSVRETCSNHLNDLNDNKDIRLRSYRTLGFCAGLAVAILFI